MRSAAASHLLLLRYVLGCTDSAAESLEDFYEWLLLWETPTAARAAAARAATAAAATAAASPLLQPPPVSLLRQADEWYLLKDNPPPENYLQVSIIHPIGSSNSSISVSKLYPFVGCLSLSLSVSLTFSREIKTCCFFYLFLYPSLCLSVSLSVSLCLCLSLSVSLCLCLSVCLPLSLCFCPCLPSSLSLSLSLSLSVPVSLPSSLSLSLSLLLQLDLTEKLRHKLRDYRLKLQQDADPENEVADEDASSGNPFFSKRMQRLFYLFHCDRFDILPVKTVSRLLLLLLLLLLQRVLLRQRRELKAESL